ncbi:hypothetical protein BDZ45DRAFT_668030 [Acephala macrosclerotiorum]|nr:hypothetical protein BDZ45DRAFT_668030 [Acephala macrosclerotiorum]
MAQRVEESDDELPDLEDLVKNFRAGNAQNRVGKGKSTKTEQLDVDSGPVIVKRTIGGKPTRLDLDVESNFGEVGQITRKRRKGERLEEKKEGGDEVKTVKEVKKKRVLNQRVDNPLLRPLNARSVSSEPAETKPRPRLGRSKKTEDERDVLEDEKPMSRGKTRSVTPSEEPNSEEENNARVKPRLKSSKGKNVVRSVSEDLNVVPETNFRSITPVDEPVFDEELEKPTVKSRTRKAVGSKQPRNAEPKLESEPEEDYGDPEEKPAPRSRPRKAVASKQRNAPGIVPDSESEEKSDTDEAKSAPKIKPQRAIESKHPKRRGQVLDSEEEEPEEVDFSDDLSDFVVNDSTFLECDDSVIETPPPPPRSTRKLIQGRRQKKEEESDDGLNLELKKLSIKGDVTSQGSRQASEEKNLKDFAEGYSDDEVPVKSVPRKLFGDVRLDPPKKTNDSSPRKNGYVSSSDIEDPFTLRYSPSESKPKKVSKETRFATPPGSPEPKSIGLKSPKRALQRIPSTPHRQSIDTFWQQDVINDWIDEYSPKKLPGKSKSNLLSSPKKSPVKADRVAKAAKKAFSERKHEIAESFLKELDDKITNGQISKLSASTGGVKINWSKKLNTTAGRANWKRETLRSCVKLADGTSAPLTHRHHAAIELAEKVIDDEDRLLNVIAHEFCHLANFMVSNIKTNPHGKEFKAWASKVSGMFGERGIEVTTKHSYEIDYKYIWECENCGIEFKRHSKSIDPKRHQCGSCKSKLVQTKPTPKAGTGEGGEKKVNEYQVFMRENMKKVKEENPGSPQKEIMGLVGKKYKEFKASKLGGSKTFETVEVDEIVGEKEGAPDDGVGDVVRKLDFLDLTSP